MGTPVNPCIRTCHDGVCCAVLVGKAGRIGPQTGDADDALVSLFSCPCIAVCLAFGWLTESRLNDVGARSHLQPRIICCCMFPSSHSLKLSTVVTGWPPTRPVFGYLQYLQCNTLKISTWIQPVSVSVSAREPRFYLQLFPSWHDNRVEGFVPDNKQMVTDYSSQGIAVPLIPTCIPMTRHAHPRHALKSECCS